MVKIAMLAGNLVVNGGANVIIIGNAQINVKERDIRNRNYGRKLKCRVKAGHEVMYGLKFQAATTCNSKYVVDVHLAELRYKAGVLARNITHESARRVRAHLAAHGDSTCLLEKFIIKREGIDGQYKFSKTFYSYAHDKKNLISCHIA